MPEPTSLPMFPLGEVLLPGTTMPLHVFEPRYREMVRDCLRVDDEAEFGQVLILRGSEAGGGDERATVATAARMMHLQALDEQRYAFVAVGVRRIVVEQWLPDDPYPLAEVAEWPDVESVRSLVDAMAIMQTRVRSTRALASTLAGIDESSDDFEISEDATLASFQLCALVPIGPADRYRLLSCPGPSERLQLLDEILDDVDAMLKFRLS